VPSKKAWSDDITDAYRPVLQEFVEAARIVSTKAEANYRSALAAAAALSTPDSTMWFTNTSHYKEWDNSSRLAGGILHYRASGQHLDRYNVGAAISSQRLSDIRCKSERTTAFSYYYLGNDTPQQSSLEIHQTANTIPDDNILQDIIRTFIAQLLTADPDLWRKAITVLDRTSLSNLRGLMTRAHNVGPLLHFETLRSMILLGSFDNVLLVVEQANASVYGHQAFLDGLSSVLVYIADLGHLRKVRMLFTISRDLPVALIANLPRLITDDTEYKGVSYSKPWISTY